MTGEADFFDQLRHAFVDNDEVKIHYVTLGEGPLVVMIHGFPDFWYTWRHQMAALAGRYTVAAMDLRGYNQSDSPIGASNYTMAFLESDVVAVMRDLGRDRAILAGHDFGGYIAWSLAMHQPRRVERLIICNLPHPRGLRRELVHNPEQRRNSQYARDFQKPGAHKHLSAERLARWIPDPQSRSLYIEAFERSNMEAMLNYYKANYPREPYTEPADPVIKVQCPVLMFHGLQDKALLPQTLNDTWQWLDSDLTLVTLPKAGHFVHHDAAERVSRTIRQWLEQ